MVMVALAVLYKSSGPSQNTVKTSVSSKTTTNSAANSAKTPKRSIASSAALSKLSIGDNDSDKSNKSSHSEGPQNLSETGESNNNTKSAQASTASVKVISNPLGSTKLSISATDKRSKTDYMSIEASDLLIGASTNIFYYVNLCSNNNYIYI